MCGTGGVGVRGYDSASQNSWGCASLWFRLPKFCRTHGSWLTISLILGKVKPVATESGQSLGSRFHRFFNFILFARAHLQLVEGVVRRKMLCYLTFLAKYWPSYGRVKKGAFLAKVWIFFHDLPFRPLKSCDYFWFLFLWRKKWVFRTKTSFPIINGPEKQLCKILDRSAEDSDQY